MIINQITVFIQLERGIFLLLLLGLNVEIILSIVIRIKLNELDIIQIIENFLCLMKLDFLILVHELDQLMLVK